VKPQAVQKYDKAKQRRIEGGFSSSKPGLQQKLALVLTPAAPAQARSQVLCTLTCHA